MWTSLGPARPRVYWAPGLCPWAVSRDVEAVGSARWEAALQDKTTWWGPLCTASTLWISTTAGGVGMLRQSSSSFRDNRGRFVSAADRGRCWLEDECKQGYEVLCRHEQDFLSFSVYPSLLLIYLSICLSARPFIRLFHMFMCFSLCFSLSFVFSFMFGPYDLPIYISSLAHTPCVWISACTCLGLFICFWHTVNIYDNKTIFAIISFFFSEKLISVWLLLQFYWFSFFEISQSEYFISIIISYITVCNILFPSLYRLIWQSCLKPPENVSSIVKKNSSCPRHIGSNSQVPREHVRPCFSCLPTLTTPPLTLILVYTAHSVFFKILVIAPRAFLFSFTLFQNWFFEKESFACQLETHSFFGKTTVSGQDWLPMC